jgi:hypothetical protein
MSDAGYALISTVLDVRIDLPVEIVPGVFLRKASQAQVDRIRPWLSAAGLFPATTRFEFERVPVGKGNGYRLVSLPREEWKYLVLDYEGRNDALRPVAEVLAISMCPLRFDLVILEKMTGDGREYFGMLSGPEDDWQRECYLPEPTILDDLGMVDIRECFELKSALDGMRHEGIARAMALYTKISAQRISEFMVLAYFSVIEMLLTHQPGDREIGDSIRHQLQTKIPLLEARMPARIDYSDFAPAPPRKVWDMLYTFRSAVAHGNHIDWGKSLKGLKSQQSAMDFLQEATRGILRQALREPDLVTSLKAV